ncbi:MAG TPA: CBS domain-containing protein [Terrimicrobiaceae bacterium]|nr:CBS domain-containing protein [Terrimicrobiaceae bacterium]
MTTDTRVGLGAHVMKARDIMTREVVSVGAEARAQEIARLMLANHISAVPVIDGAGAPIGMVSEGDLIGRNETEREAREDWWLALLAEGEPLSLEFLSTVHRPQRTAGDVMSRPVITVSEDAEASEIVRLLQAHRIKRVPVVRDGKMVGIVSRENLLRALAGDDAHTGVKAKAAGLPGVFAGLVQRVEHLHHENMARAASTASRSDENRPSRHENKQMQDRDATISAQPKSAVLTPDQLHRISEDLAMAKAKEALAKMNLEEEHKKSLRDAFISREPPADALEQLMVTVRHLAEQGETEMLALQFPANYLDDHGRKINNLEPDWPTSLTGFAKRAFEFYERNLKPHGYKVRAQILDYPGGMPGDVGIYLVW